MAKSKKENTKKTTTNTEKKATYTKEELINAAETAFNVRPHLLAGALRNLEGEITKEEAKKKLDAYKSRKVKR